MEEEQQSTPPEVEEVAQQEAPDSQIEEEVEITLGEESLTEPDQEEQAAPSWVKDLRKSHREAKKENRELQRKVEELSNAPAPQAAPQQITTKPTLEAYDYDSEKFEEALSNYHQQEFAARQAKAQQDAEQQRQAETRQRHLDNYEKSKAELKRDDYLEAEDEVVAVLDPVQQDIILQAAQNPALAVYALGKSKDKAKELASIKDPVKFAFALGKLENQLKVSPRKKAAPAPEAKLSAGGKGEDSKLEQLRAKGNFKEIVAYRRKLRSQQKTG
jgi:hypothetical protein